MSFYRHRPPLWCYLRCAIGLRSCHFDHVGIEGERGIYRCHCGAEFLGLKTPIVIGPGETVDIRIIVDIPA